MRRGSARPRLQFGDFVHFTIAKSYHGKGYVIGEPDYSKDYVVVVLSNERYLGIPINESWCTKISAGHHDVSNSLRDRFEEVHPGWLKKLS